MSIIGESAKIIKLPHYLIIKTTRGTEGLVCDSQWTTINIRFNEHNVDYRPLINWTTAKTVGNLCSCCYNSICV